MPPTTSGAPAGLSIFFPAYNDGGTIASMVVSALLTARELTPDHEVIVVNDGSSDATPRILDELARMYPPVRIVHHEAVLKQQGNKKKQEPIILDIERKGKILQFELINKQHRNEDLYPYKPRGYTSGVFSDTFPYGIFMTETFLFHYIRELENIIRHHHAKHVLLFSSRLVQPVFLEAMTVMRKHVPSLEKIDLRVTIAEHRFWGGNIMIADILLIQDFINHLHQLISQTYQPDLIIIPSSFANTWGFDLSGRSYLEIEREFNIPVE